VAENTGGTQKASQGGCAKSTPGLRSAGSDIEQ